MISKRIIACLDILNNKLVKGTKFINLINLGEPKYFTKKYYKEGIDEIVILNINKQPISLFSKLIKNISKDIFIPITSGGNINTIKDVNKMFRNGTDRIVLNSTLYYNRNLLKKIVNKYGKQSVVISIDVKKYKNDWYVYLNGGKKRTKYNIINWINKFINHSGELLITCIENDGKCLGYNIKLIKKIIRKINNQLIISGGGDTSTILKIFKEYNLDGGLIASILHKNKTNIKNIKTILYNNKIRIRL